MSVVAAIRNLIAQGFTMEQALTAAEAFEAAAIPVRTARQDRNARYYAKRKASENGLKASEPSYSDAAVLNKTSSRRDARVEDNLPTKNLAGQEEKKDKRAAPQRDDVSGFSSELSVILDDDRVQALIAVRRKKRAPIDANTGRLLVSAIRKCPLSPADVADEMALRNWTSVKPEWLAGRANHATAPPGRRMNAVEAGLSLHEQDHDLQSRTVDHRDDEWVSANVTRLPGPVEDLAGSFAQRFGRGGH